MSVLVGRKAPDFTVPAVLGTGEIVDKFNLHDDLKGKYGLVFFTRLILPLFVLQNSSR